MPSILDDIKSSFRQGNILTRLIYINLAVFVVMNLVPSITYLFVRPGIHIDQWFSLPSDLGALLVKPWTLFTYMFLHVEFFHILFNLLWFYFIGRIFMDLLGERRLLSTYILGGLVGGVFYVTAYNIFPSFEDVLPEAKAMGASASIMAIIVGIATKVPNYSIRLIILGDIKLKYIAMVFVIMDLISMSKGNAGGRIAHLGGALFGYTYIKQLDKGRDWSIAFYHWVDIFKALFTFKKSSKVKVVHRNASRKRSRQEQPRDDQISVDAILDKISKSGYDSLSKEEKDILFRASQNK